MLTFIGNQTERQFNKINITGGTYAAIGDSITSGVGVTSTQTYHYLLGQDRSVSVTNLGESGQTLTTNAFRSGLKSKLNSSYGKDLITVFAGTNDWSFNIPLGSELEIGDYAIRPCMNYFIQQIKLNSPSSVLIFILPTYRERTSDGTENVFDPVNDIGLRISDYVNAEKQMCIKNGVRYSNAYDYDGLKISNIDSWTTDDLHLNASGHASIESLLFNTHIE